jgi:penicillin V acylase-like amidase (Ntn superfamily)
MRRYSAIVLLVLIQFFSYSADACFILFLKDENNILVANHEDWFANDAAIKINPPMHGRYGSVTFTFLTEGWAQGGMNEKGLFFDAAQTPFRTFLLKATKQRRKNILGKKFLTRRQP